MRGWRQVLTVLIWDHATRKQPRLPVVSAAKLRMRASTKPGRTPRADIVSERDQRSQMNIVSQQKQTKRVVEHKGVYPKLGSDAVIDLQTESLTWDTFCPVGSQISLTAAYLQFIQWLAWDTLSHLRISDNIHATSRTFYFARAIRPVGRQLAKYFGNSAEIPSQTVADPPSKKFCPEAASWWLTR
jgi:hypothetical protein